MTGADAAGAADNTSTMCLIRLAVKPMNVTF
jgi:hypothetical protein